MNIIKSTYNEVCKRILKEPLYFYDSFEGMVFRTEPIIDNFVTFAKIKDKQEFKAKKESKVAFEAIYGAVLISKEDYDKY